MPMKKGQKISSEALANRRKVSFEKLIVKYDWNIAEPFLDVQLNIGARNRQGTYITLREFKEKISKNKNWNDIEKEGVCPHLIQFFSNFLQGKIKITERQFYEDYQSGMTLEDISKKYNIYYENIAFLRQLYGIKNTGAKFQIRKISEIKLIQEQKDILYGSMMGDADIYSGHSARFKCFVDKKDYLFWKYNKLKNIAKKNGFKSFTYINPKTLLKETLYYFYTDPYANTDVDICIKEFFSSGKKEISKYIFYKLTPLSIAIWFMDSGITDFSNNNTPVHSFCTESFSKESCELIKNWFNNKYNIKVRLGERKLSDRMGYRIIVNNESQQDFINLIKPYILPYFLYKIDYNEYIKWRENKNI